MEQNSIDLATVATLKEILEDDFTELIETFLMDANIRITEMKDILANDDAVSQLEFPAHTLKGSSGNVGAVKLSRYCAQLVDSVREGDTDTEGLMVVVDDIVAEYGSLVPQLNSLI